MSAPYPSRFVWEAQANEFKDKMLHVVSPYQNLGVACSLDTLFGVRND